jgi:hypothetical protein
MDAKLIGQAVRRLLTDAAQGPNRVSIEQDGSAVLHAHPQFVAVALMEPVDCEAATCEARLTLTLPDEEAAQITCTVRWNTDLESLDFEGEGWHGRTGRVGAYANRLDIAAYREAQAQNAEIVRQNTEMLGVEADDR